MSWFYILIGIVVVLVIIRAVTATSKPAVGALFRQKDFLFTAAERSFLDVLEQATAGRYRVFGKVRVADVLTTAAGLGHKARAQSFNRVRAKHFDFVLCDPNTLTIKAVVELNDSSHNNRQRAERDQFLRGACQDADLPLKEVRAQRSYSVEMIRRLIAEIEPDRRDDEATRKPLARIEPGF